MAISWSSITDPPAGRLVVESISDRAIPAALRRTWESRGVADSIRRAQLREHRIVLHVASQQPCVKQLKFLRR